MPLNAQTAKFVVAKKISEQASTAGTTTREARTAPRQDAGHGRQRQRGIDHGHHPPVVEADERHRRSAWRRAAPRSASERRRSIMPANSAEAATGETFGACSRRRAATSKPIRNSTSSRSGRSRRGRIAGLRSRRSLSSSSIVRARQYSTSGGEMRHATRADGRLAHSATMPSSASRPSVSAAGPGCRISVDLISRRKPSRTAGIASKPGRAANFRRHEFLAAPGADDDVGPRRDHLLGGDDAVLGALLRGQLLEHVDAAGGLDQLRHPADAGDHRLVPFLEIDARPARQPRGALRAPARAAAPARAPARRPCRPRRPARRACGSSRRCRRRRAG